MDVVGGERAYLNTGYKTEANAFAKATYDLGRFRLFGDAQVRRARFRYEGDAFLGTVSWTFFNPKLGARFDATKRLAFYASLGRTTREPTRPDLLAGEDNASAPYDLRAVEPERVNDLETGLDYHGPRLALAVALYAMQFRDEIALTGELSEIGLPLRRNVDRSFRRGVELEASYAPLAELKLRSSANLNHSRIGRWTQYLDVYDDKGALVGSEPRTYPDVTPLLTPLFVGNLGAEWSCGSWLSLAATGRYASATHLDNTGDPAFRTPAFFNLDATAVLGLSRFIRKGAPRIRIQVNNVLNNRREFPSGYSYLFLTRGPAAETLSGISYYYPLATRSLFVNLDFKL
jgi:iron complex outermembrane receptor protein